MSTAPTISFVVTYKGSPHSFSLSSDTPLSVLHDQLFELTSVPPSNQKLLYKGKKTQETTSTLSENGFKNGLKIQMLGTTAQEVDSLHAAEEAQNKRDRIMRERALKAPTKVRSTSGSSSSSLNFRFHQLTPLPHLPNPDSALALLQKLADDPAIKHVMQKHQFSVGVLTELAPHEHPELLGLNVNAGQAIKLRIRTDRYDGFRLYKEVRRVLCHELTHNVWGDHDNNFKELNSQLNREVLEFEGATTAGTHSLLGEGDVYEPSAELEARARGQVLGGPSSATPTDLDTLEDRRRRILQATMARLQKEDEELEKTCGTHSK